MEKDLQKRGVQPAGKMEDFWSKETQSKASQFQGMYTISHCSQMLTEHTEAPSVKGGRPRAVKPIQGNRGRKIGATQAVS
jgi:hypothetical protein